MTERGAADGRLVIGIMFALGIAASAYFFVTGRATAARHLELQAEARAIAVELDAAPVKLPELRLRVEKVLHELRAEVSVWRLYAKILLLQSEWDMAVLACGQAMDPEYPHWEPFWIRAQALARLGKKEEAAADIEAALRLGIGDRAAAETLRAELRKP